ncbi:MAG: methyltransferase [Planctomycetota bacterium]|nr:methyltransferase [Planctomycetota bacterium]
MMTRQDAPRQIVLPALYRSALRMTRKHGMNTLSRIKHRMFPAGQVIRLETGAEFFVPPDPHFFGYIVEHERHISRLMAATVEEGDTCLDVGANIGYFTATMAAKCGSTGRVLAYEPEAANFAMLAANAEIAGRQGFHVDAVRAAVSDRAGTLALVRGEESTLHQVAAASTETRPEDIVPCVNLAEDLQARGIDDPIKLLKIDVEGHEAAVLEGCADLFRRGRVRTAVVEVTAGEPAREIAAILDRYEAEVTCWLDGRWQKIPVADLPRRTDIQIRF